MKLTWLGHSCFLLESGGWRLLLDPYEKVRGLRDICTQAHEVLCSHQHFDHNYRAGVTLLPQTGESPFTVRKVPSFHDEQQGALRGENTIHLISDASGTVAHLGDLGAVPDGEMVQAIGQVDVLLLPVGGVYTIDPAQARETARLLGDPVVVPMHYRLGEMGLENIAPLSDFLALWPREALRLLEGNSFLLQQQDRGAVVVPRFQG